MHFVEGGKMFMKSVELAASDDVHVNAVRALLEEHIC